MAAEQDQSEIRELQLAYGSLFDSRDAEAFAELFTDDAVLIQIGGKEIRTKDKFAKAVRNMPPAGSGFHRMLETSVEIAGAVARATCQFAARSAAGADVAGHYEDEYRRTPSGWRFTRRAVFVDPSQNHG
jgi:uncharacterized protein (TIGR02246 family)